MTEPDAIMVMAERGQGLGTGQLYMWRRQLLQRVGGEAVPQRVQADATLALVVSSSRISA